MYCRKCGKQIPDNSRFCSFCGEDLSTDTKIEQEEHGKKRKVVFDGEIHKCPNCGEILDAFVTKCPTCGFEIRGTKGGTNKVEELAEKLQKTNNISKKKELISNFYVPNTKEDILEFFTLAVSQIDDDNSCSEAWCSKLDQTLIKARLSFGNTDEYKYLVKLYDNAKKNKKRKDALKNKRVIGRIIATAILALVGTGFMLFGIISVNQSNNDDNPMFIFIFIGFFMFLAIGFIWLNAMIDHDNEKNAKKKKKKVTTVTRSNGSKKTVEVKKVEVESSQDDDDDGNDESDDEEEEEEESETDGSDENDDSDSDEDEIENETTEVEEVEETKSSNDSSKSLKEQFKDIGKEFGKTFKDMFK